MKAETDNVGETFHAGNMICRWCQEQMVVIQLHIPPNYPGICWCKSCGAIYRTGDEKVNGLDHKPNFCIIYTKTAEPIYEGDTVKVSSEKTSLEGKVIWCDESMSYALETEERKEAKKPAIPLYMLIGERDFDITKENVPEIIIELPKGFKSKRKK